MSNQLDSVAVILAGAEATAGRLALIETVERQGREPPCHRHYWEDELIYVLAGELALYIEGKWLAFPKERAVMVPRSVEHTFSVLSGTARLLTVFTPAGFEGFYRELGEGASQAGGNIALERWVATAARYGCEITGPHPGRS
jgi:quercetin dioxygenase-like cupin family protein